MPSFNNLQQATLVKTAKSAKYGDCKIKEKHAKVEIHTFIITYEIV
jgi:hypothetical protein